MPITVDVAGMLRVEDVHLGFQAPSVIEAIPLLLRPALERQIADRAAVDAILRAAVSREEETPTRCGPLSLPHARSSAVSDFILALGINPAGVLVERPEPRLMFAFVSPEARREQHLQLLASLARLSQNEWLIERICSATRGDQVMEILRTAGM